jgi:hypothetical protein
MPVLVLRQAAVAACTEVAFVAPELGAEFAGFTKSSGGETLAASRRRL